MNDRDAPHLEERRSRQSIWLRKAAERHGLLAVKWTKQAVRQGRWMARTEMSALYRRILVAKAVREARLAWRFALRCTGWRESP